jgi:pre-mRNA-splicing helicase BRR2
MSNQKWVGYDYKSNSNLVLNQDRSLRNTGGTTGEPESLAGRMTGKFGDRTQTTSAPKELKEKIKKRKQSEREDDDDLQHVVKKSKKEHIDVLNSDLLEGITYRPKTKETKAAYEVLLNFIVQALSDQPENVIMSAADEVLAVLKDESIAPADRQGRVEEILGSLSTERYSDLIKLGNAIKDYNDEDMLAAAAGDVGISVVFGEGEDDNDYLDEVPEGDEDDEEEPENRDVEMKDEEEDEDNDTLKQRTTGDASADKFELNPKQVDAYWLQRELNKFYTDSVQTQKLAVDVLNALQKQDVRECENELVDLLEVERFDFIRLLVRNRWVIAYCTRLGQAQNPEERRKIEDEMSQDPKLATILDALQIKKGDKSTSFQRSVQKDTAEYSKQTDKDRKAAGSTSAELFSPEHRPPKMLDLDSLTFQQGSHVMSNKKVKLPPNSFRQAKKGYEEVHIPAMKAPAFADDEQLVKISSLPEWSHAAFEGMSSLNRIQSRVYKGVFEGHDNVLLCAPTGAGKTNVAMLAMMHEIGMNMDKKTHQVDLDAFKIVYIAPMKSLVQEMVHNFGNRLKPYGITVRELTGDQNLTKQQISETQVIVTTPEKWDIITRKSGDRTYTQLVRLVIIDEIHLLHDDRGPVLEAIVARTIRQIESTQEMVRIVGLSATLPNYQDVAAFLRVKPEHLYAFNNSYRPIPLQQAFIGITVKAPLKRYQLMNEITYEKVVEQAGVSQILVFVHSRKETAKTARALRDMAMANDQLSKFLPEDIGFREILLSESKEAKDPDLQDLLPHGFAIHHAGMKREDRTLVEDLFRDRCIQVLVSTATLAWGVNLPARTVIIKGTQVYNAEKGRWAELSPMDILQMLGRAGRPQYDKQGEGLVITTQVELQYYLSLLNQQLPIESQFISRLPDMLNAEIVLGTIQNVQDAVNWLGYTYLYVCMLRNPGFYGVTQDQFDADRLLEQRRYDLVHTAATFLAKNNLIKYDRKSGAFQTTDLGRVASHYYITYKSMNTYNEYLRPTTSDIELLKIFSLSGEFQFVAVRPAERLELEKLLERVPIPVKENIEEPTAKINVLLQAYISNLKLEGFSLASDMVYVTQSASRIMRCMYEIALKRGWAQVAERCLSFCKMIDRRMWSTQSPLRQFLKFKKIPEEVVKKLEKKDFNLDRLYELNSQQIGELIRYPALGKTIYAHVHQFPRLQLEAQVQPITRTLLRVELEITPDFEYVEEYHQNSLPFWIIVEDIDGENILHHEMFVLKQQYADQQHYVSFTVPISDNPLPPQYFIKAISDRWIGAETVLPISFRKLILPEKYPPHTELLDLQPLPVAALKESSFEALYNDKFKFFNPIQTQVFSALYNGDLNTLVCAPTSSGKTICAEFAILHELSKPEPGKVVYVAPSKELVQDIYGEWGPKFAKLEKAVTVLTGDSVVDLKLLDRGDIILSTPENWDQMSRRWKQRKQVQNVKLFIIDELHLIGSVQSGPTMEVIVSRMRYISQQLKMNAQGQQPEKGKKNEHPIRVLGLASSLANATDLGEWIGATPQSLFNFHPNVRPIPLEIHIQGFDNPNYTARMLSMSRPLLYSVSTHAADKPTLVFVPTRKLSRDVTRDLITHCNSEDNPKKYLHCSEEDLKPFLKVINSRALREALSFGVAFLNESLTAQERDVIAKLFKSGAIQVVVVTHSMTWHINTWSAYLVIIMGTQFYEGKEHRYADYPISDVLQMIGRTGRAGVDEGGKCMLFCHTPKKEFYKKFIYEPLPIESQLHLFLHDHFNAEIVTKTIENKQDAVDYITWSFFYRRLTQNPNYYKLTGITRRHLSDYLSELVEDTLKDLEQSKCIAVEENDVVAPLNLGMIAAYYYVQYTSIELFNFSITAKTKMKGLIEILANATEFERLPIRHKEPKDLQKMANHLPVKINKPDYHTAATKANVLLQSYFSRKQLSTDLEQDEHSVVLDAPRLLQAMVDVISSNGSLTPALAAMELSQMITQAVWDNDSVFKQLPHFNDEMIERLKKDAPDVETIFDFVDMDDASRKKVLSSLNTKQTQDVARVCNRYPNIDMAHQLLDEDNIQSGASVAVAIQLERDIEEGKEVSPVPSLFYPKEKQEGWWVLVGDPKSNQLLAIKKVSLQRASKVKLEFTAPEPGDYNYTVYLMSDSWIGCDQEYELKVNVKPADEDSMRD